MRIAHPLWVLLVCGMLTACGSGNGNSSAATPPQTPPQLGISPNNVTLTAGSNQQFTASLTNGSAVVVTWAVGGPINNPAVLGTITANGLYTAPAVPPLFEPVTVSASPPGAPGLMATAQVTVEFSNASLNGQYVFTFDEIAGRNESRAIGIIVADGNGNITGTEDVNAPSGAFTAVPITGQYSLSTDGQGTLTLNGGGAGTLSMTLSLFAGASGGTLVDNTTGQVGNGHLISVTSTVNSLSSIQGNYLFNLGSGILASTDNSVGLLDLSNGSVISGSLDENNGGNYTQNSAVSGSYAIAGGNRGTLTLIVGSKTSHFIFYAVSNDQLELLDADAGAGNFGELNFQTNTQGSLNSSIFQLAGVGTGTTPDVLIATNALAVDSSGNGSCGNNPVFAIYENYNGNYKTTTSCFTFPAFTSGRSVITIPTPFGARNFVFYVQSTNPISLLETSSGFGNVAGYVVQTEVGASVPSGQYVFSTASQAPNSHSLSTLQGILQVDSNGNVTGQAAQDVNGAITTIPVTGVLTPQNTAGAGDAAGIYVLSLDFGGGQNSSYFLAASSNGVLSVIGTDAMEVSSGGMVIQKQFIQRQ